MPYPYLWIYTLILQEGWKRVQESEMFQKLELSVSDIGDTIEEFKDVLVKVNPLRKALVFKSLKREFFCGNKRGVFINKHKFNKDKLLI